MKKYPRVLTIAGSDSGGGAGIQADIKAISATGSYAASAITAVTVQNTLGVEAVHPVPTDIIAAQIRCVLSDIGADAIKIGMLHSAEVVLAVRDALLEFLEPNEVTCPGNQENVVPGVQNIVLDPVMVATSGHRLIEESAIEVLRSELLPLARVITPNIPEAEILAGVRITSQKDLPAVARQLSESIAHSWKSRYSSYSSGGQSDLCNLPDCPRVSVLLKAGHLTEERLTDVFFNAENGTMLELPSERLHTPNTHGTGCTLSSALASYLAQGLGLDDAARAATDYIHQAIVSGAEYTIGHGHGPVDHFWSLRRNLQNADNQ